MGASMLRRSQTTSSHIRVISKNSSSASFSRFVSCTTKAPRNAKKRAATRLRSAPTVGQSTQGTPYIRGVGGHEIFLRSPQMPTASARQRCYIFILRGIRSRGQIVSIRPGARSETRWFGARGSRLRPARREARTPRSRLPRYARMFVLAPLDLGTRAPEGGPAGRPGPHRPRRCRLSGDY
jgi:hypothetical protein